MLLYPAEDLGDTGDVLSPMLKLSSVVGWSLAEWWPCLGDGAFKCSLNLSRNVLADSPLYTSLPPNSWHLHQ